jgi:hypothetical protein
LAPSRSNTGFPLLQKVQRRFDQFGRHFEQLFGQGFERKTAMPFIHRLGATPKSLPERSGGRFQGPCEAAWNKDPVFGVIGIQSGPPGRRVHSGFRGETGARLEMLVVETIAKIRRAYFAPNKPIKTICREFRVSRRVVRKVIRSQATEFRYQRSRQPLPRIDP